jgi:competence protein ComEA
MKKLICIACCSIFLFSGCGKTSYFQSTELVEVEDNISAEEQVVEDLLPETIFVQVAGAVVHPDVYQLPSGSRVFAAIEVAGGLLDSADVSDINQAQALEDGEKLYVYTIEEATALKEEQARQALNDVDDGLININTASASELMTLPGIGEAKAKQIVAYRDANGDFSSIEDIKNVSGIGDGIFTQINMLIKI